MKIFLHGYLQDLHPEPITVQASTVAEALSSLQLIPALVPAPGQPRHSVAVDGFGSQDALYDRTDVTEIHLRPVMVGAGQNSGVMQIVIGVVMIAVAIWAPWMIPAFAGGAGAAGTVGLMGAMMILGGVMSMLAPQPSLGAAGSEEERSKFLGQAKNTVAIGTRIPIILGRHKWGGHFISFDIDAGDLNAAPASWYESPFTDYTNGAAAPAVVPMSSPSTVDGTKNATITSVTPSGDAYAMNFSPALSLAPGIWNATLGNGSKYTVVSNSSTNTNSVAFDGVLPLVNLAGQSVTFTKNYDT